MNRQPDQPIEPGFYDGPLPGVPWQPPEYPPKNPPDATTLPRQEHSSDTSGQRSAPDTISRLRTISIAMDILSFRLILLIAVVISGLLFVLVALWPDWIRLAAAAVFAICVTGPVAWLYRS